MPIFNGGLLMRCAKGKLLKKKAISSLRIMNALASKRIYLLWISHLLNIVVGVNHDGQKTCRGTYVKAEIAAISYLAWVF